MSFLQSLSELGRGLLFLHGHVVTPRALDALAPADRAATADAAPALPARSRPVAAGCRRGTSIAGCT